MKLLYITAPYCGACKIHQPHLQKIAKAIGEENVLEIDGTKDYATAKKYGITKVPTTIVTDGEEILYKEIGKPNERKIKELFKNDKDNRNAIHPEG